MQALLILVFCSLYLGDTCYGATPDTEWKCLNFSGEICKVGNVRCCEDDEDSDPVTGYILYTDSFNCNGRITAWKLDAYEGGTLFACVWEPFGNGYKLISYNKLPVTSGKQTVNIPLDYQINVKNGFVIGVIYDELSDPLLWAKIVGSVDDHAAYEIKQFRFRQDKSADLQPGDVVDVTYYDPIPLQVTLEAIVEEIKRPVRLFPNTAVREGRAEFHRNGDWFTICDKWFQIHGWALTFCRCLGYPDDSDVRYVKDLDFPSPVIPPATISIGSYSPRMCTLRWNTKIIDCPQHPNGDCSHNLDVSVKCQSKWRCIKIDQTSLGIGCKKVICQPQYWIEGLECWSDICETRGAAFLKNDPASWANAYCKEVGFDGYDSVLFHDPQYFKEPLVTDVTCAGENTLDIKNCQTRFRKDETCPYGTDSGLPQIVCKDCFFANYG